MASLRPVVAAGADRVVSRSDCSYRGGLLYSATVCGAGRQAAGHSIHNPQSTGRVWSFQFSFFCEGGVKLGGFPSWAEKRH